MKVASVCAALIACASPAYAVTITFEDGDVTGGGVFSLSGHSITADPLIVQSPASGNVLFVVASSDGMAAMFFDRGDIPVADSQWLISSFDIRAVTDTTLLLGTYQNGDDLVGSALEQSLTAGVWTTITTEYGSSFIPSGISIPGDIRADGGFYIDNITVELVNANYRPTTYVEPIPTGGGGGIPEPATWAMLILGFGLVGGAIRAGNRAPATSTRFA